MKNPFAQILKHALDGQAETIRMFQKAALQTTDFGTNQLSRDEADMFISEVVARSKFFGLCTIWRTNASSGQLNFFDLPDYIIEHADEAEDVTEGSKFRPTFRRCRFVTEKARAAIDITRESDEDNIEGPGFRSNLMSAVTTKVANNLETLGWSGDENQAGTDSYSKLLRVNDGWLKQLTTANGCNVTTGGGARLSFKLLDRVYASVPVQYKTDEWRARARWIVSPDSALALVTDGSTRATNLGDQLRTTGTLPPVHGIPFEIINQFPQTNAISGTASLGSQLILGDPKNFVAVIQRQVSSEWERKPRKDLDEGTIYTRTDYVVKKFDDLVYCDDISVDPAVALYT